MILIESGDGLLLESGDYYLLENDSVQSSNSGETARAVRRHVITAAEPRAIVATAIRRHRIARANPR